jgi:hypothetical protein
LNRAQVELARQVIAIDLSYAGQAES